MSTTIQTLVNQIATDLLEPPPGIFATGLVSQQEVLDLLGQVIMDYLRQTGISCQIFTQQMQAAVSAYQYPDRISQLRYVLQNANILNPISAFSSMLQGNWRLHPNTPLAYHQDNLPINTMELVPAPNWNGTPVPPTVGPPAPYGVYGSFQAGLRNLTIIGTAIASKETWLIGDTLDTVPDSLTPYLVFGVLRRIFSKDGETRDAQRAAYCQARYTEGINLGRSFMMHLTEEPESKSMQAGQ